MRRTTWAVVAMACMAMTGATPASRAAPTASGGGPTGPNVVHGPFLAAEPGGHALASGSVPATTSYDWSGYVQVGTADQTFTEVTDTFTVPTVDTPVSGPQYAADWVGIGGFDFNSRSPNARNLVQAGVEISATTNKGRSKVVYDAWTEMLPRREKKLHLHVSAGDVVSVTVQETATNKWTMTVDDTTTGLSRSRTARYHSTGLSAEAIHERPCIGPIVTCADPDDLPQLAQTSNVTFDPGSFSEAPPGAALVNQPLLGTVPNAALIAVTMTESDAGSTPIATASDPNSTNDGFAVADGADAPPPPSS